MATCCGLPLHTMVSAIVNTDPSLFYSGLIAELYQPLASGITESDRFVSFVKRFGEPALELCCGTGLPLLDLAEAGLDVDGLDSSPDMLAICESKALERKVSVLLYLSRMQDFRPTRQYRCAYIAHGSITLLPDDESLDDTLTTIQHCLTPNGVLLVDFESPKASVLSRFLGKFKEVSQNGFTLRVGMTSLTEDRDHNRLLIGMKYERMAENGTIETAHATWLRKVWSREQFLAILAQKRFEVIEESTIGDDLIQVIAKLTA